MLKKFVLWFIVFGLSFLVSNVFGWTEQGKAFLYIDLGSNVIIMLILIVIILIAGHATDNAAKANGISAMVVLTAAAAVVIALFATWGATKLFDVDFFVAYQIMSFGQCLCTKNNKKDD